MVGIPARSLCAWLFTIVTVFWASTAFGVELYIPPVQGEAGQTIEIPVMIDWVDNLAGMKLVMKYDPHILTFKKGARSKYTDSLMHIINSKKPGLLVIVMAGARGIKGKDFPLLLLTFDIKKGLKGNHNTQIEIKEIQLMSDKLKVIKCKTRVAPITILPSPKPGRVSSYHRSTVLILTSRGMGM